MGPVAGLRLLHLQCAHGSDSLSWANLGAVVTGVDFSAEGIAAARGLAAESGVAAEFVVADVLALPAGVRDFDVVYTGGGALCWMPDLDRWAAVVAGCLRPGGVVQVAEHHPVWEVVSWPDGGVPVVSGDYFSRGRPVEHVPGARQAASGGVPSEPFRTFVWPVGDVVSALVRAGLRVELLEEHGLAGMFGDAGGVRLPSLYVLRARKPV